MSSSPILLDPRIYLLDLRRLDGFVTLRRSAFGAGQVPVLAALSLGRGLGLVSVGMSGLFLGFFRRRVGRWLDGFGG